MVSLKNGRDLFSNVYVIGKCIGNDPYAVCHEEKETG
jgi:hypothetical protein